MSSAPSFAGGALRVAGARVPGTVDTSLTAPTNVATVITGASTSTKIEQIRINQVATTAAASTVNLFLHDGTTYYLLDFMTQAAATTLSATAETTPVDFYYRNLWLPSTSWTIKTTVTVNTTQSFMVIAFGADY